MFMKTTALEQFEQELINESRRILDIMLKQYNNNEKTVCLSFHIDHK